MKIHIIENDEYEEYNNKTNLRLITNNLDSYTLCEDDVKYNTNKYKNNFNRTPNKSRLFNGEKDKRILKRNRKSL